MIVIILAAGEGKRMNSNIPKVLHKIQDIPFICKIIQQGLKVNPEKILLVVGKNKESIKETIDTFFGFGLNNVEYVLQENPLGTGHAVLCCKKRLLELVSENVIILNGDTPMITAKTIEDFESRHSSKRASVTLGVTHLDYPCGYGRILEHGTKFLGIVEERDCSEQQKKIKKVNCGIYCFNKKLLCKHIDSLKNNNKQNEYYLPDLVKIINDSGVLIDSDKIVHYYTFDLLNRYEIFGVNTQEQLKILENFSIRNQYEYQPPWSF